MAPMIPAPLFPPLTNLVSPLNILQCVMSDISKNLQAIFSKHKLTKLKMLNTLQSFL